MRTFSLVMIIELSIFRIDWLICGGDLLLPNILPASCCHLGFLQKNLDIRASVYRTYPQTPSEVLITCTLRRPHLLSFLLTHSTKKHHVKP